ncbi:MAG: hypothetical protein GY895_03730 [Phycisphaera sp.]|nr:hypothetical protein [Phycisphaera sp.]
MLTIRKFLKTLIGTVTPFQVLFACILGSLLGFLPVTSGGTAAALAILLLLLVLNANIFLAGVVAAGMKLVSIATAPIAFEIGRILIDGPTRPIAAALVNGPVTAWLGFDSYLAVGGLVLGLVIGVVLGIVVSRVVIRLRSVLGGLEEGSDAFRILMERRTVRWAAWILFGGIPKDGFASSASRRGLPFRLSGLVFCGIVVAGIAVGGWLLADGAAKQMLVRELTRLNGSTVDIDDIRIEWFSGRAELVGLQISDPEALDRNLFAADRLTADLDLGAVLRRRFAVDDVIVASARLDVDRTVPATREEPPKDAEPAKDSEPDEVDGVPLPEGNLEDYLKTAEQWKDRLRQVQGILEKIANRAPVGDTSETNTSEPATEGDSLEAWLREQVDLHGYAGVRAGHLLEENPTVVVRRIEAAGIRMRKQDSPTYDLLVQSVSTQPNLVETPPSVDLRASDESLTADLSLGRLASVDQRNRFDIVVRGLQAKRIVDQLVDTADPPFEGGTIDAAMTGVFVLRPPMDLAGSLEVVLRDCTIRIGKESATIAELPVRLDLGGRIDDPAVAIDQEEFASALQAAGADALAARANEEAQSQVDRGLQNLEKKTGVEIPDDLRKGIGEVIGGGLDGLFGGKSDKD